MDWSLRASRDFLIARGVAREFNWEMEVIVSEPHGLAR